MDISVKLAHRTAFAPQQKLTNADETSASDALTTLHTNTHPRNFGHKAEDEFLSTSPARERSGRKQ